MSDRLDQIAREQHERWDRAARRMPVSLMSDAKWRKALATLAETNAGDLCTWKFVFDDEPTPGWIPSAENILESWVEPHCLTGAWGVVPRYAHVEWLELRAEVESQLYANAPVRRTPQDIDVAEAGLRRVAVLELERTDLGLRLYGYRRLDAA